MADLVVREYGSGMETVIALHGGPAAAGDVAPLARELGLALAGRVMTRVYGFDIEDESDELPGLDATAHDETWSDMVRLQLDGTYPAAFAAIAGPVLMIHGAQDPHPGPLIRDDLRAYIPHLEYQELPNCGHSPWLERQAAHAFFDIVNAWIETP